MKLILGDSLDKLAELPTNTIDAIVTDAPYGLKFMQRKWDYDVPSIDLWKEALRVLKPGAHVLCFGGTRTYHRMVQNIEEAGFEVRDMLAWLYGSGFPKSQNVAIAIDKQAGAMGARGKAFVTAGQDGREDLVGTRGVAIGGHEPITDAAKRWQGFGTALKPANEPIVLARKPLEKGLTVAQNVLKWGTGALAIDASRIGTESTVRTRGESLSDSGWASVKRSPVGGSESGRWPANVLFDEEAAAMLDEQSGVLDPGGQSKKPRKNSTSIFGVGVNERDDIQRVQFKDKGGASRFFYCAKSSKSERNAGLEFVPQSARDLDGDTGKSSFASELKGEWQKVNANHHPTVKPIKLMEYLVRMITPPGGIVLDPFMGSGTTGCAARKLGYQFIGIEREAEYLEIARKRIEHWAAQAECADDSDPDQLSFPEVPA